MLVALLASTAVNVRATGDTYEFAGVGELVKLAVTSDGSPAPTFQWTKSGAAIPGATASTLVLPSVTTADTAVYNAIATNSAGWALSNDLILTVGAANPTGDSINSTSSNVAPAITLQPYPSAMAPAGSSLTLSVAATGVPEPTYQWQKNGVAIPGATNPILAFSWLTTTDSGTYTAVASNVAGSATSNNSALTVTSANPVLINSAPVITAQPQSQTVVAKSSVTFTVAASGTPMPTFQWYKNGAAINDATDASFTLPSVSRGQAATYTATATNSLGSATSNGATLTVTH